MIIFDNHMHLRRDGRYLDAIKEFKKEGGTHFVLCQYPNVNHVIKEQSYLAVFQQTIDMAEEIKKNVDVTVYTTVGPYPVDYLRLKEVFGREKAIELMNEGMDTAAQFCQEGKSIGIGEIGRPHFPVDTEIIQDSNRILQYGMKQAKRIGVPVILHTETTTPAQCKELALMGEQVDLAAHQIVKHFSPPLLLPEENFGLMPSVLASKKNIERAIQKGTRFLMETDYIDDPRRPGAVLGPKTVPRRTFELLANKSVTEEDIAIIHQDNPEKTYNIQMEE
ncbi:MAG: TatD family hydrolase [Candidatus Thermoplasmatota archaeon]|nr:TatD family hydrolase [Candidatus Thermoplasmatota archaeon]